MAEILIDFDGTVVEHEYPLVGPDVPDAVRVIKDLITAGHNIIIFTMRSGKELEDAVNWYVENGINLYGINTNPTQHTWTTSPKAYGQLIIDDISVCCPLIYDENKRPYVDWNKIEQELILKGWL